MSRGYKSLDRSKIPAISGKDGERVFGEHRSLVFKTLQVVRFYDRERKVLVYVSYSDRVIAGSPQNSMSTVSIMGWPAP